MLTGSGRARIEFAPRPEFGQVAVALQPLGDGLLVLGSNEPIALHSPGVEWSIVDEGEHETARAIVDLDALGGRCELELRFGTTSLAPPAGRDRAPGRSRPRPRGGTGRRR